MSAHDVPALIEAAAQAASRAYAPYSRYRVGAALRLGNGEIVCGCNVENASFGLTLCAERVAVAAAVARGERSFAALAIVAEGEAPPFPCGACRQTLAEFCAADFPVHVATAADRENIRPFRLGDLLPHAFARPG